MHPGYNETMTRKRYTLNLSGDGLTQTEREILRRWDEGQSRQAISRALGMTPMRVKNIVNTYHDAGEQRRDDQATAAASAALRDAILSDPRYPGNQA